MYHDVELTLHGKKSHFLSALLRYIYNTECLPSGREQKLDSWQQLNLIEPIALLNSINNTRNIALAPRTKKENNRQIRLMCFLSLLPPNSNDMMIPSRRLQFATSRLLPVAGLHECMYK